jgi:hypothetical protein
VVASYVGYEVLVLDAATLETVTSTGMVHPWGMTVDPGSGRVWIGGKFESLALALPGLEVLAQFPLRTRTFVQGSEPNTLYAVAPILGKVVRIDGTTGEILASLSHPHAGNDTACIALANSGAALLAGNAHGPMLVLDPMDLRLRREIPIPFGCYALIPLDDGNALVLGGGGDSLGRYPTATVVDWQTGVIRQVLTPRPSRGQPGMEYGYGNPWVRVDDLIFAAGRQGILVADARNGEVLDLIEGTPSTEGTEYCCEIAWDPVRKRLLIVGDYLVEGSLTGKLVSYRMSAEFWRPRPGGRAIQVLRRRSL